MDGSFPFPRGRQVDRRMPAAPLPLGWITAAASARKGVAGLDISLAQAGRPCPSGVLGCQLKGEAPPAEPHSQDALILESGQQVGRRDLCQNCWGEGCLVKGPLSSQNPHLRDSGAPTLCLGHFKEKFSSMNTQPVAREVWVVRVLLVFGQGTPCQPTKP